MGTGTNKWYTNISILLVVVISVVGIGMAGLMLLLVPRPPDVLRATMRRMSAMKTFHVETEVSWRGTAGPADAKKDESLRLTSQGDVDLRDPEKTLGAHKFAVDASDTAYVGEYRRSGDTHVFRFSDLPERIGGVAFDVLRDAWLRLDLDALARRFELPVVGGGRRDLTLDERRTFIKGLLSTPFVVFEEYVNTEQLDGGPVYHYKVSFEPLFIKDLVTRIEAAKLGRELTEKERTIIDAYFADTLIEPGEAWIGTKDDILRRLRLRLRHDSGKRTGVLDVTLSFSRVDQPVSLTMPTDDVVDATPIVLSLLPGLSGRLPLAADGALPRGAAPDREGGLPMRTSGVTANDSDGDGLPNVLETFYGSDPHRPDSDGDGIADGAEVERGMSPNGDGALFDFTGGRF